MADTVGRTACALLAGGATVGGMRMRRRKLDFVVFSDDWGRHASSCQHLFDRLARRHRVLWVNTIGLRAPKVDSFTLGRGLDKFRQWSRPLRRIGENLHVYAPAMLPAAGGSVGRLNAEWVTRRLLRVLRRLRFEHPILFASIPTAADYLGRLGEQAAAYYITDDYRFWPGANPEIIATQDARLTAEADLVLPCGEALAVGRQTTADVQLLRHAVDLDHFVAQDACDEPADLASIPHPRLCFFGLIYEKIDLDLFARVARTHQDKHLVLIGPVKTDISALAALPNVHVLGPRPYADLPRYLRHMDVLLLAYRLDEQTTRNAPLKIRECLAAGKPTVAKGIHDLEQYAHLIHITDSDEAYVDACGIACRTPKTTTAAMRAAVAPDTWEARAQQVEAALDRVLTRRRGAVATPCTDGPAPCTDPAAWDAYVAGAADGCVWHRWGWMAAMQSAYDLTCHPLAFYRHGRITGVLPLALQTSHVFGRRLISLPWLDYAGAIAEDDPTRSALIFAAGETAATLEADLTIRQVQRDENPYPPGLAPTSERTDKVAMTLDLPADADALWTGLRAKVRNQVRKAEKSDLTAAWAGAEGLEAFYRVYATNMRDLGSPPHSKRFFADLMERLGDVARLMLVDHMGRTVAGALVLTDPAGWQVPWASSLRAANALCPNHLMYWTIVQAACGKTERFCFGRSSRESGTYRFKSQWGATETPLLWRTFGGDPDDLGQSGRVVGLVQRVWRRMPVSMAKALGPSIIRCVG